MAFWTIVLAGLSLGGAGLSLALWRAALGQARRADALEAELEGLRDVIWTFEDRAAAPGGDVGAKASFLATVTHEMRTPLSGVIGTAELLLDTRLAPDQRTYAGAILKSAGAMLSLVDELLDNSRMELARPSIEAASFEVAALVEEVAELLAPRAQAKGLDLATLVARDAPAEIVADRGRVRQILLNLAGNALKFTDAGGAGLRVERAEGRVRFVVADTGPGFDPADKDRLFRDFERASTSAASGNGLGLAISRRLAEAMGGSLDGDATPGRGATFTLELPAPVAAPVLAQTELLGRRIVVASEAPFSGPWLVEALATLGADAWLAEADATPEALAAFVSEKTADVVVVDRAEDARDLAAAARRGGAATTLLMLAPAERGDLESLAADGFDGYLVKPVRAASLASRIETPRAAPDGQPEAVTPGVLFPARGGMRILVAEDDPVSALIALAHLARLGHSSTHVADGRAACEAFDRDAFDAVLLDLRMPLLDGCAAAKRMREIEASNGRARAKIVALTANAGAQDRDEAIAAGMDEVLAKPLDRRALETVLEPLRGFATQVA